jgi:S-DNA-T family DNA segregation ATPase FtsK/SpoIIIE
MTAIVIEARWVAAGLQNQLRTAWRWWCTVAVIAGLGISAGNYLVAIIAAAYVAGLAVWARVWPHSYVRLISLPLWRSRTKYRIRKVWLSAVVAAGLETRMIAMNGRRARSRLRAARMKWSNTDLLVRVTLAVGMTVDDVKAALPSLTSTFGALSSKFVSGSQLWLCFRFADSLASIPCSSGAFESDRARNVTVGDSIVGSKDDGTEWALRLSGRHTLIAGVSGAGKSSLFWAIAAGLGPQISDGLTRLHGIDLKGGVELAMGREMFCRIATDTEHAVLLLEDIVVRMRERMARMAGRSRQHRPSQDEPLEVVFVDEIAACACLCV